LAIPESYAKSPALQFIVGRKWDWKEAGGGQICIEECPFCHKKEYKFYMAVMNPEDGTRDGLYFCHHGSCQTTGNLRLLQEHLGVAVAHVPGVESRSEWAGKTDRKVDPLPDVEACHAALMSDAEAVDYLLNVRGFTQAIIDKQKLGLKEKVFFREAGEVRALVIPYLVNGNVVYAKYRTLPPSPKDFSCPSGWEAPLYNGEILVDGMHEIIFVEGEADCISCLSNGIVNVVGVPGAGIKKAAWIETLDRIAPDKIYILYDNDKAGKKGAQEIASRIGIEKCLRIVLPGVKDVNEFFTKGGTPEQFEKLKADAQLFDVTGVSSSGDALQQLEDELAGKSDLAPKYLSQWPSLNALVGFEDGDVIDILAPEKVGKTTLGMNLMDHMCSAYGEDGLIVCLEMTQARLAKKWVAMLTGFEDTLTKPGSPESKAKLEELKAACVVAREVQKNRGADLYFAYPLLVKTPEDVFKLIRDCIRRYGVKWVMFDNIQRLCDDTLENKGHRTVHLSQISKGFTKLAKDFGVKLIRILQPRQIEDGQLVQSRHTDGSSQIAKDCDCLITMWRSQTGTTKKSEWESGRGEENNVSFDPKIKLTVALSRYSSGGSCSLHFDGARSQVREYEQGQRQNMAAAKADYNSIIPMEGPIQGLPGGDNGI
jgi:replicative DNA helicase